MKSKIPDDVLFKMAKANTLEEFIVIKDLYGLHNKKLNQHDTLEFLMLTAAQHMKAPNVAIALLKDCKHVTIGDWLLCKLDDWTYNTGSFQPYIKRNLCMILDEVKMWFPFG